MAETDFYRDRPQDGTAEAIEGARRAMLIDDRPLAIYCLDLFAAGAAARGDAVLASRVLAATEAARESMGVDPDEDEVSIRARSLELMGVGGGGVGAGSVDASVWAEGRALDLAAAVELASAQAG
jgi:hypothetical protein